MFIPNYLKSNQKKLLNIERFYLGVVGFGLGGFVCLLVLENPVFTLQTVSVRRSGQSQI